ncbi:MAG: alanine--tRNA ligase, partial [Actinobacteria bacterium]|nr:alanine--tRNA ligase [Actinomycetota bacterium]
RTLRTGMESRQIRERFLSFFEERGHTRVPSSSLIPQDPSLLLTTAGMVQFKPYFLGEQDPPFPRATSVQKSFRTTDIENVGLTARHLTLFEMLGNFSFGDYFKEGAIAHAWDLVTGVYGIEPDRLWATIFQDDDEAEELWRAYLPDERIVRRGMEDNFWHMGVAGPCGPSSEIFVDRGPKYGTEGGPAVDEERYLEIWNLVFMQNIRDDDFNIVGDLSRKGIDTGSGLERVALVLQDVASAYETDLLAPMLDLAQELTGRTFGQDQAADVSLRIIAEHGRATTLLIADGVLPSNEGRGYVLRRMLRRVVAHARRLGVERPVVPALAERTIEMLGEVYPELQQNRAFVAQVAASEEEHFGRTLRQGLTVFEEEVAKVSAGKERRLPGDAAFRLHDTYGFPLDVTVELANEGGLEVDIERFAELMQEQRTRARAGQEMKRGDADRVLAEISASLGRTEPRYHETTETEATVRALLRGAETSEAAQEGDEVVVVLDRTSFYPEGGGQVGDAGEISTDGGAIAVEDTRTGPGQLILHQGRVARGEVRTGQAALARVDPGWREGAARAHTATHVLHWTIRSLLGEHARQAGSLVRPGQLRFDFTHFSGLSPQELERAEETANARLAENAAVRPYETTQEYARSQGAIALFEEKYGDIVRVVEIGDYSIELCGGTHVPRTGHVAVLRLLHEASIGAGLRRVEAVVGPEALKYVNTERRLLEEIASAVGARDPEQTLDRVRAAVARTKELERELERLKATERDASSAGLLDHAVEVAGVKLLVRELPGSSPDDLRELALSLRDAMEPNGPGAAVLAAADGRKVTLVATVTSQLTGRGLTAPRLIEAAAAGVGGRAGGKDHLAFGGGGKPEGLAEALAGIPDHLASLLLG